MRENGWNTNRLRTVSRQILRIDVELFVLDQRSAVHTHKPMSTEAATTQTGHHIIEINLKDLLKQMISSTLSFWTPYALQDSLCVFAPRNHGRLRPYPQLRQKVSFLDDYLIIFILPSAIKVKIWRLVRKENNRALKKDGILPVIFST